MWRAHDMSLDAPVAIKFMSSELSTSEKLRSRFEHEAKAAARIRSPHIVQVLDHGVHDGQPYICMELLEGVDLGDRLRREPRMSVADTVRVCRDVCKGLHRAHSAGIVHRDLKPANIFLSSPDNDLAKILDFGIAKSTVQNLSDSDPTASGQLLGSPHYMSPEQARGMPLDGRSDLWSLAIIAYRMLTGARPFTGNQPGDVLVKICTDVVKLPTTLRPDLPVELDSFFLRALAREPSDRFPTARDFGVALTKAAGLRETRSLKPPEGSSGVAVTRDSLHTETLGPSAAEIAETEPEGRSGGRERTPPPVGADTPARPRRHVFLMGAAAAFFVGGIGAYLALSSPRETSQAAASQKSLESTPGSESSAVPTASVTALPVGTEAEPPEVVASDSPEVPTRASSSAVSPVPRRPPPRPAPRARPPSTPPPTDPVLGY